MVPRKPNKDSWKTGLRNGSGEDQCYLKTVRILASKLFPLLEAVVFMDSSEEGELGEERAIKKEGTSLESLFLKIDLYIILSEGQKD